MKKWLKLRLILLLFLLASSDLYAKQSCCISNIYISGNKITKSQVILRELPFKQGDILDISYLDTLLIMSRNNLLNLSLFNYVYVTSNPNEGNFDNIDINIHVEERWYIWPMISFIMEDRNLSSWLKEGDSKRVTIDAGVKAYNILGMNHTLTASYKFGYQKGFRLEYDNITIDHQGKHRLGIGLYGQFSKTENFISLFNTPVYNRPNGIFLIKSISSKVSYTFRPKIRTTHTFALNYEDVRISDSLLKLNPGYWGGNDTVRRGYGFNYIYTCDQRDNVQYPLEGYSITADAQGYVNHDRSFKYASIRTNIQFYLPITKKWNISANLSAGLSKKNAEAYIFDKAIGYEKVYLRGYEYYVNDGQHYITFNPTLKYLLMPTKVKVINFLSFMPQFNKIHFTLYGKAFFDMGYSYHAYPHISNYLSNKFLCSGGLGVDLISYYDLNFSVEYSFNQLGEHGFFFSIKSLLF